MISLISLIPWKWYANALLWSVFLLFVHKIPFTNFLTFSISFVAVQVPFKQASRSKSQSSFPKSKRRFLTVVHWHLFSIALCSRDIFITSRPTRPICCLCVQGWKRPWWLQWGPWFANLPKSPENDVEAREWHENVSFQVATRTRIYNFGVAQTLFYNV